MVYCLIEIACPKGVIRADFAKIDKGTNFNAYLT